MIRNLSGRAICGWLGRGCGCAGFGGALGLEFLTAQQDQYLFEPVEVSGRPHEDFLKRAMQIGFHLRNGAHGKIFREDAVLAGREHGLALWLTPFTSLLTYSMPRSGSPLPRTGLCVRELARSAPTPLSRSLSRSTCEVSEYTFTTLPTMPSGVITPMSRA